MDFSRDVNEITRFIKASEAEAKEHRKRFESVPVSDPKSAARVREILADLQTLVKVWLTHVSAASKYPFQAKVVPTSEAGFDVHIGHEIVSLVATSPAKLDIEDRSTHIASMVVHPTPFLDGLTPILVDALKRELSRQIRAAALTGP